MSTVATIAPNVARAIPQPMTRIVVNLPQNVVERYERMAEEVGLPIEDLVEAHLTDCSTFNTLAGKGLFIDAEQRRKLEEVVKRNFSTGKDLLDAWVKASTISLDGVAIPISQAQKLQLEQRAKNDIRKRPYKTVVSELMAQLLENYLHVR